MKTNAIIRIILFTIAILVLVSILVVGILAGIFMTTGSIFANEVLSHFDDLSDGTLSSSGAVSAEQVNSISIDWAAGSITIQPGDVDAITFSETGVSNDRECMVWKQSGNELEIQYCKTQVYFGIEFNGVKDLIITVPKDWVCSELEIDAASASLEVNDLTISEVDFDGASGICEFKNCTVNTMDIDTASGHIRFSGSLNVLDTDAASANCTFILSNTPNRIDMDMASGDLDLTLPADCGFTATLDTLSGRFSSDFATTNSGGSYLYGNGSCHINVSGMSGDISIHKGE